MQERRIAGSRACSVWRWRGKTGCGVWSSRCTCSGSCTYEVIKVTPYEDINLKGTSSRPFHLTNVNGRLFFTADDGASGTELWKSDGTAAGTVLVKDIIPGSASSDPYNLTSVNGRLFFTADN